MLESLSLPFYLLFTLLALTCAFFLGQAIYPRLSWVLTKWQYRNPDMVEPSTVVFQLRRVKAVVLFTVFLTALVLLFNARETLGA
ncbi:hypothetical protein F4561_004344 [Lipingzhangella halophila]|uniref:DUF6199 domain-containing protein n=1 Tax=Lipingzhangella halophila TaxID=1783352 RepID=A0A7W7W557_9ACTN|nr:hypothetical protein [Lipingzhangella halophila]MBB4933524.1 hypothetical protein [Lipingzhangella halophila]